MANLPTKTRPDPVARAESGTPLGFSCSCGKLQGHLAVAVVKSGSHIACYCRDCRAAQLYLNQPDPSPGPVELLLTTPDNVTITKGAELLAPIRLSPRGPMRWRATCCNTPLCSTGSGPKVPFVGFLTSTFADPDRVGPVIARTYMPKPGSKTTHEHFMRVIVRLLPQVLTTRISGRWRNSPFFNTETSEPVNEPTVLSKEERKALYPAQRSIKG